MTFAIFPYLVTALDSMWTNVVSFFNHVGFPLSVALVALGSFGFVFSKIYGSIFK